MPGRSVILFQMGLLLFQNFDALKSVGTHHPRSRLQNVESTAQKTERKRLLDTSDFWNRQAKVEGCWVSGYLLAHGSLLQTIYTTLY